MNYLLKHWRGDLSLGISFWVNVVLVNVLLRAFDAYVEQNRLIENPVTAARVALFYVVVTIGIIYVWQIVGLWRCTSNHIMRTGKTGAARVVQGLIILGLLATAGNLSSNMPLYRDFYVIGFQKDEYSDYTLTVTQTRDKIHLKGGLGLGISKDFQEIIEINPKVTGVILDSYGGRLYEGRELSKLISRNRLNTYSLEGCFSACVTAFVGGRKRFLGSGANIGIHQYVNTFDSMDPYVDLRTEEAADKKIFLQNGVSERFVESMFHAANEEMWYPTNEQLLASSLVHGFLARSEINPIEVTADTQAVIEKAFGDLPAYDAIQKYNPDLYGKMLYELVKTANNGGTELELQGIAMPYISRVAETALPKAQDQTLISFISEINDMLRKLHSIDPILCVKMLYPEAYGTLDFSRYLTTDEMAPLLEVFSDVIVESYEQEFTVVDQLKSDEDILLVILSLEEKVDDLEFTDLNGRQDYSRHCLAVVALYENVLKLKTDRAANLLRSMFSDPS